MRILPTIYLGGASYYGVLVHDDCEIEQWETFEKQTFRNRCLIRDPKGEVIRLSVPVGKAEHKQLTKDIRITYQSHWQHQHWTAIESAYRNTPYFDYYADYLRVHYERQYTWLMDLNEELNATILQLLHNVGRANDTFRTARTTDWRQQTWTDKHPWQSEISILNQLFERGPETILWL